jgi:hypothetical protein
VYAGDMRKDQNGDPAVYSVLRRRYIEESFSSQFDFVRGSALLEHIDISITNMEERNE